MYLPDHYYLLPQDCLHLSDINDIYTLYALKYPTVSVSPVKGSYSSFVILAIAYECHYITFENMTLLFPGIFTRKRFMSFCRRLSDRGLLKSARFLSHDNASYTAYCLTEKGLDHIETMLSNFKDHNIKVRRTGGKVSMHDYCMGINMQHMFVSPFRYEWVKEAIVDGKTIKRQASLCPDLYIQINSVLLNDKALPVNSRDLSFALNYKTNDSLPERYQIHPINKRIYIEEDLGTETTGTILQKIFQYDYYNLFNEETVLVFSIRKCGITYDGDEYSHRKVSALITQMEESGIQSLYEFYEKDAGTEEDHQCALQILLTVGVVKTDPSKYNQYIRLGTQKKRDFTLDELKRFFDELTEYRNLYRIRDYHAEQARFTRLRKEAVCSVLEKYMADSTKISRTELLLLLSGKSVFFLPTNLFGNYFPLLFPDLYQTQELIKKSLSCYGYAYEKSGSLLSMEDDSLPMDLPSVMIKNVYKRNDGLPGMLIIEDVGHDLSACVRVLYLRKYYKPSIPFTVISIVDSMEDAVFFSRSLSFYHVTETLSKNRSGYYYILTHDIGRENKIFTIGDIEGIREIYLKPDSGEKQTIADFLF